MISNGSTSRSFNHLPISVFGDLLDGEEDRNAEDVAGQGHIISGDFKTVGPRQAGAREGRTDVSPADFTVVLKGCQAAMAISSIPASPTMQSRQTDAVSGSAETLAIPVG